MSFTFMPSSPPTITPEAARTQRSPVVNTGTPATPELDRGADLGPSPTNEAAETPDHLSEQIRAPAEVGGSLGSLWGDALRRAMDQISPASARVLEGKFAHRRGAGPPSSDLPDPQTQGSAIWEPEYDDPKARVRAHQTRRPVPDKSARVRPDPWPSLGVVTINWDACLGSASLFKGEQNIHLPSAGSKHHATQPAPQNPSFSPFPPSDTLARENPPGEGAGSKWRATNLRPKRWKPPDTQAEDLQEAGRVPTVPGDSPAFPENVDPFGLAGVAEKVDAGGVEPSGVDIHERGGALPVVGAAPALAERTAGVEPAGETERAHPR